MKFRKFAFRADADADHALHFALQYHCTDLYIVGRNSELASAAAAAKITVHEVTTKDAIPADVFQYFEYEGCWASVETGTGAVVATAYAEDSWAAAAQLLSKYAPGYRERFHVQPAKVELLAGF